MKNTFLLSLLLLVLSVVSTYAAVEVLEVVPISGCGNSDGSITIIAQGTAGPFFITVTGPNGYIYTKPNHQGELTISNLSEVGAYNFNIGFHNSESRCGMSLSTNLPCLLAIEAIGNVQVEATAWIIKSKLNSRYPWGCIF